MIAFFNDTAQDYAEKDALLSFLITVYRRDSPGRLLSGFFIILFRPAIAALYRLARKRDARLDEEEFIQEVCTLLLEIIATVPLRPQKVAMQIVGPLRNRIRSLLNRELGRVRLTTFSSTAGDGDNEDGWEGDYGDDVPSSSHGRITFPPRKERRGQKGQDEEGDTGEWQRYDLTGAESFLTGLVAAGVIHAEDRDLIHKTVIEGRPLKDLTANPREYQRLKKRRQRTLAVIRKYLRNMTK